uniref:C-repeat binding facor 6 n=1 Tax=Populus trichocarpa TaxID=3694 RepID=A9PL47_POPTR|nr:C-repeat binding facor 6 [Populus trichocarpa]
MCLLCPTYVTSCFMKNKAGRKKFKETRHPVYRGVRRRNGNKWVCEVREPNKKSRIWVGTFKSPEMAARAHDVAALALKGELAALNFLDSALILPRAKSSSARDIQRAALAATEVLGRSASSCSSSSSPDHKKLSCVPNHSNATFFDEEALFNMPGLLDSMAEGLILTPPAMARGVYWDDMACSTDLTLWEDDYLDSQ